MMDFVTTCKEIGDRCRRWLGHNRNIIGQSNMYSVCPEKEIMEYENTDLWKIETDGSRRVLHSIGSEVGG